MYMSVYVYYVCVYIYIYIYTSTSKNSVSQLPVPSGPCVHGNIRLEPWASWTSHHVDKGSIPNGGVLKRGYQIIR